MELTDIKQHVTHFSEQLRLETKHREEVTVGGKILSIIPPITDDLHSMYVLVLDDKVGTHSVYISETLYQAFPEQFKKDNHVFLEGFVNVVNRHIKSAHKKEVSVFAYAMKDITREEVLS